MAKQTQHRTKHTVAFWLILLGIGLLCFWIIRAASQQYDATAINQKYAKPFESRMHNAPSKSGMPHSHGLQESSMNKYHGRHYDTY